MPPRRARNNNNDGNERNNNNDEGDGQQPAPINDADAQRQLNSFTWSKKFATTNEDGKEVCAICDGAIPPPAEPSFVPLRKGVPFWQRFAEHLASTTLPDHGVNKDNANEKYNVVVNAKNKEKLLKEAEKNT